MIFIVSNKLLKKIIMSKEQVMGVVRHGLTFLGGLLVTKGLLDEGMLQEVIGSVITLVGAVWSIVAKKATTAE
jgi:hypothetical protein